MLHSSNKGGKYFVHGHGRDEVVCADLMSYLLFTPNYSRALIDIGYHDADRRIDEIEEFLYPSDGNGNLRANGVPRVKLATPALKLTERREE